MRILFALTLLVAICSAQNQNQNFQAPIAVVNPQQGQQQPVLQPPVQADERPRILPVNNNNGENPRTLRNQLPSRARPPVEERARILPFPDLTRILNPGNNRRPYDGNGDGNNRRPYDRNGDGNGRRPYDGNGDGNNRRPYDRNGDGTRRQNPYDGNGNRDGNTGRPYDGDRNDRRPYDGNNRNDRRPYDGNGERTRGRYDGDGERLTRPRYDGGRGAGIGDRTRNGRFPFSGNGTRARLMRLLRMRRNMPGMMCDTNGRPRGRTGSPYVARLTSSGTELQPCNRTRFGNGTDTGRRGYFGWLGGLGNRIGNTTGPIFGWMRNFFGNGTRPSGPRVFRDSVVGPQQAAEGARASDPGSSEFTTSTTASMAVGGILLVVVGGMFAAVLIVLNVRLAQLLRS